MAHLRDVRGGKGEQGLFHDCVAWLQEQHPLTLITNLREIVEVNRLAPACVRMTSLHTVRLSSTCATMVREMQHYFYIASMPNNCRDGVNANRPSAYLLVCLLSLVCW